MHRLIWRIVMGLLCGWLAAGAASAQYNYQNYLVGDRAAGMGGAAAASAEGVDACYYNPAGLAQMRGNSLSLSGSLYGKQAYRSQDGMFPGEDARYNSFVTIPTTVGGVWKMRERLTLAFSVLVPERMAYNELRSFRDNTHVYNYSADEQMLWFGPSAAWQVDERLSCGVSLSN
ncbi:MAG: outer membrane protein transport protein [Kiritimatiellia bacterium]